MNLLVSTIPEDPATLAGWLERQLVGLDLARLVAELSAIHELPPDRLPIATVLAGHLDDVYRDGLGTVPRDLLRHLLMHPALLLQLQELVLMNGGPYWDALVHHEPALEAIVERGRARLACLPQTMPAESIRLGQDAEMPQRKRWYSRPWVVSLLTAALVLVAVGLWHSFQQPAAEAWGWDRPGALSQSGSRAAYLQTLADEAQEWFNKRPETAPALARRINQFRQGCSTLILAEHKPLPEDDRRWLVERCRKWAEKIDHHLSDLEGGKDVETVRREMDATVDQLIKALHQRAEQPA